MGPLIWGCGILFLKILIPLDTQMLILQVIKRTGKALENMSIFRKFSYFLAQKKQTSVVLSTTKFEYLAVGSCGTQPF